jgi:hypothetical protein
VKFKDEITNLWKTAADVPHGSVSGPVLYLISTRNLPTSDNTTTGTFTGVTAVLATHEGPARASMRLGATVNKLED